MFFMFFIYIYMLNRSSEWLLSPMHITGIYTYIYIYIPVTGQKPPGQKSPDNKPPRIIEEIIAK